MEVLEVMLGHGRGWGFSPQASGISEWEGGGLWFYLYFLDGRKLVLPSGQSEVH